MKPTVTGRAIKAKLATGTRVVGGWITIPDPAVAEIMAQAGFDFLTVDMEHSPITLAGAAELIRVISLCEICPLVRLGANDPTLVKRVLDAGAGGIIVPMINNEREARAAVGAAKYPPAGYRSVGLSRAQGYGTTFEEYFRAANDNILVIAQIEHTQAVANIDAILGVPGLDAFLIGPYDLSASMGRPGQFSDPEVAAALSRVSAAGRKHRVPAGFHSVPPSPPALLERIDEGYGLVVYSVDFLLLGETCRRDMAEIRRGMMSSQKR